MKLKIASVKAAVWVVVASFSSSPCLAQDFVPYTVDWNSGSILATSFGIDTAINDQIRFDKSKKSYQDDKEESADQSFRYTPSRARTRANLAQFVAKTRTINPSEADKLQSFFASTDVIGAVGSEMRKVGLRTDDVADAYAVWWVLAWYAVQGRESQSDANTFAAVREQAARAFGATGKFDDASDAVRQEMAESLIIQAAMVDAANDQMRGDRNQRRALAAAVNKGAGGLGLDLTSMTLTPEGFQPRRGSDWVR